MFNQNISLRVVMRKILGLFFLLCFAAPAFAAGLAEQQKIVALLDAVSNSDITFISDGEEHTREYAREYFVEELINAMDVKTADDFISKIASNSNHTGKPYMIKLKNGTQVESAKWLHAKLKEIENIHRPDYK